MNVLKQCAYVLVAKGYDELIQVMKRNKVEMSHGAEQTLPYSQRLSKIVHLVFSVRR